MAKIAGTSWWTWHACEIPKWSFYTIDLAPPVSICLQELATYDQLPEFAEELARLLQEGVDERGESEVRLGVG